MLLSEFILELFHSTTKAAKLCGCPGNLHEHKCLSGMSNWQEAIVPWRVCGKHLALAELKPEEGVCGFGPRTAHHALQFGSRLLAVPTQIKQEAACQRQPPGTPNGSGV